MKNKKNNLEKLEINLKNSKLKTLFDAEFKKEFIIKKIILEDKKVQEMLSNLGVKENEKIKKICSNYFKNSFMVSVVGINFALDKQILKGIFVE